MLIHNSDELDFAYVIESLQVVLGYELTQATNCAYLIDQKGSYIVKTFGDKDHADATVEALLEYEFDAEVIDSFA